MKRELMRPIQRFLRLFFCTRLERIELRAYDAISDIHHASGSKQEKRDSLNKIRSRALLVRDVYYWEPKEK